MVSTEIEDRGICKRRIVPRLILTKKVIMDKIINFLRPPISFSASQ